MRKRAIPWVIHFAIVLIGVWLIWDKHHDLNAVISGVLGYGGFYLANSWIEKHTTKYWYAMVYLTAPLWTAIFMMIVYVPEGGYSFLVGVMGTSVWTICGIRLLNLTTQSPPVREVEVQYVSSGNYEMARQKILRVWARQYFLNKSSEFTITGHMRNGGMFGLYMGEEVQQALKLEGIGRCPGCFHWREEIHINDKAGHCSACME